MAKHIIFNSVFNLMLELLYRRNTLHTDVVIMYIWHKIVVISHKHPHAELSCMILDVPS